MSECGPDAITKTKKAYREKFGDQIDQFGERRGLVLEKMVLKDNENGERLEVNMRPPPTYENLDPQQRIQVENVLSWKDRARIADEDYARLRNVADVPCSTHVKAKEEELNCQIGKISTVIAFSLCLIKHNLSVGQLVSP